MHGDAQFITVQHQKGCEVSRLPDHDVLIDYGLIVNRLILGGGGGGDHTPINRTASRIHLYKFKCRPVRKNKLSCASSPLNAVCAPWRLIFKFT